MNAIGGSNPEYVNARVRARRAALFDEDDYRKLIRMSPDEITRYMEETEYEAEINALGARHSGVDLIEYALHRNLAKHFHDLLHWSEGRLHVLIARYLRKYDAWNLKTVIRGIYTGFPYEQIQTDLILAGDLDESLFERMAQAESIEEAIAILEGTVYHDPLSTAYPDFEASDILVPLENAIDRQFYGRLLGDRSPEGSFVREGPMAMYTEFLQAEIDFLNIKNALRLAMDASDVDPAEYFIEGGRLFSPDEIRGLVADTDQLLMALRTSTYGDALGPLLDDLETADSLIEFERALEGLLLAYTERLANVYPVSVTSILSYILAKEREINNIRAIARGKEAGLAVSEIEQELVII